MSLFRSSKKPEPPPFEKYYRVDQLDLGLSFIVPLNWQEKDKKKPYKGTYEGFECLFMKPPLSFGVRILFTGSLYSSDLITQLNALHRVIQDAYGNVFEDSIDDMKIDGMPAVGELYLGKGLAGKWGRYSFCVNKNNRTFMFIWGFSGSEATQVPNLIREMLHGVRLL